MRKRRKAMGKAVEFELQELKRKLAGQFSEMAGRDITKAFVATAYKLDDEQFGEDKRKKKPEPIRLRPVQWRQALPEDQLRQLRERMAQECEAQRQEREAQRELALRMTDIGYKALAKEMHPDAGGSSEAMSRLNRARHHQKRMA